MARLDGYWTSGGKHWWRGDGETPGGLGVVAESLWQRRGTPAEAEEALTEWGSWNVLRDSGELRKGVSQFSGWRQVWGEAAFPATPWLEGAPLYLKDNNLARSPPWHFSALESCSIQHDVSFAPSADTVEQERWGTYGQTGVLPAAPDSCVPAWAPTPGGDSRDQGLGELPLLQLEQ